MVAQDRMHVEHYVRQDDGHWLFPEANEPEESIFLKSLDCSLLLSVIYDKVEFDAPEEAVDEHGDLRLP